MLNKDFAKHVLNTPIRWFGLVFRSLKENGIIITTKKIKLRIASRLFPPSPASSPPPQPVERQLPQLPLPPLVSLRKPVATDFKLPPDYIVSPSLDKIAMGVYKRGEKRVFKYISPEYTETYREVLARLSSHNLLGSMFVNTWVSNAIEDIHPDALFLECDFLEPITFAAEIPPDMLWDYTQYMLDFIIALDKAGLQILDPHANNATFHDGKFVYLDHGSIQLGKTTIYSMIIMIECLIHPLVLMSHGQVARAYLYLKPSYMYLKRYPPVSSAGYRDIKGYMSCEEFSAYEEMMCKIQDLFYAEDVQTACNILKEYVCGLPRPVMYTPWTEYQNAEVNQKYTDTVDLMRSVKPKSFIDLAGNAGLLSKLLQDEVEYSICADVDLNCLNSLYDYISTSNTPNIYPLYMDVTTSPLFLNQPMIKNLSIWAKQRLRCECAVALSVLHHLVFSDPASSFDSVLKCFLSHTEKHLIVEYIDIASRSVVETWGEKSLKGFPWYNQANFEKALSVYCDVLEIRPRGTRTIYLCSIKPS